MSQIEVNKDFSRIKKKVAFGLTKRQLICFLIAGILGFVFYLSVRGSLGTTGALSLMILVILPVFFISQFERDGRYLEDIFMDMLRTKVLRPGIRTYETKNIYAEEDRKMYKKEVLGIGTKKQVKKKRKGGQNGHGKR